MTGVGERRLPRVTYLSFPFRVTRDGTQTSLRMAHIREQVEQVIFTGEGERVFRPEFGLGARGLVFEPNRAQSWELAQNRLYGSLAAALAGEIDPDTLRVEVFAPPEAPERLVARIAYVVAALQKEESHELVL